MKINKIFYLYFLVIFIFASNEILISKEKYPFIYIPGMFDNGDLLIKDSLLVKNLNNEDGFYFKNYFNNKYNYSKETIFCSSNIVGVKYNRLIVANLTGPIRTDISIKLMAQRLFCLIEGKSPKSSNYNYLTNYKGIDFSGKIIRNEKEIFFKGLKEELWVKYGKKIYYKKQGNKNIILLDKINEKKDSFYLNEDGYFDNYKEIKFNVISHSSGGIAVREYLRLLQNEKMDIQINTIINLSVPQKGARMEYHLKDGFEELLKDSLDKFYSKKETGFVTMNNNEENIIYTYNDLIKCTKINLLYGESFGSKSLRKILSNYIIYFIPFDGKNCVLGTDPTLWELHPDHDLIKKINKTEIPENIIIHNFRVKNAYAKMFTNLGKYLELNENDGVVDLRDSGLEFLPNYKNLNITDHFVEKANHIPFPYIKAVFELRETIKQNYFVLRILLNKNMSEEEGVNYLSALITAIMNEFGLDLDNLLKNENYSVIDYFAENPVILE